MSKETEIQLPPLPAHDGYIDTHDLEVESVEPCFSAESMRDYARTAIQQDRESSSSQNIIGWYTLTGDFRFGKESPESEGEEWFAVCDAGEVARGGAAVPVAWRRPWNGDVSDEGAYVYASDESEKDDDGIWQPLFTGPMTDEQKADFIKFANSLRPLYAGVPVGVEPTALLDKTLHAMKGFRALVKGECPSLLDYDGGIDAENFDKAIGDLSAVLATPPAEGASPIPKANIDPMQDPFRPGSYIGNAADETPAEQVLRKLACWLGVGGYNAPTVDAEEFHRKIVDGIKDLAGKGEGASIAGAVEAAALKHGFLVSPEGHIGLDVNDGEYIVDLDEEIRGLIADVAALRASVPAGEAPTAHDWTNCPICGESHMRRELHDEGRALITCTNLACKSNGGNHEGAAGEAQPKVAPWQPIETAPRGVSPGILLWCANAFNTSHIRVGFVEDDGQPYYRYSSDVESGIIPEEFATHWMPLPQAPGEVEVGDALGGEGS